MPTSGIIQKMWICITIKPLILWEFMSVTILVSNLTCYDGVICTELSNLAACWLQEQKVSPTRIEGEHRSSSVNTFDPRLPLEPLPPFLPQILRSWDNRDGKVTVTPKGAPIVPSMALLFTCRNTMTVQNCHC